MTILEWICLCLALLALYLAGNKNIYTWLVGIMCNFCWIYWGYTHSARLIIINSSIYMMLNIWGWYKWSKDKRFLHD